MTLSQETCLNTFAEPCEEQGDVGNTWNDGKVSAYLGWNFFCAPLGQKSGCVSRICYDPVQMLLKQLEGGCPQGHQRLREF